MTKREREILLDLVRVAILDASKQPEFSTDERFLLVRDVIFELTDTYGDPENAADTISAWDLEAEGGEL